MLTSQNIPLIPADHPLAILDQIATAVLPSFCQTLSLQYTTAPGYPLDSSLRLVIAQAFYNIENLFDLSDTVWYNAAVQKFAKYTPDNFNALAYDHLVRMLINQQEIGKLIDQFTAKLRSSQGDPKGLIAERLQLWKAKNCPRTVSFQNFSKSPITRMAFEISTVDQSTIPFVSEFAGENCPRHFPQQALDIDRNGQAQPLWLSKNGLAALYVRPGTINLIADFTVQRYDCWEESFRPHLLNLLKEPQLVLNAPIKAATLVILNQIVVPPDSPDLTQFLNFVPDSIPVIAPPKFAGEAIEPYVVPRQVLSYNQTAHFRYPNPNKHLSYTLDNAARKPHADLDIGMGWAANTESRTIENVLDLADELKVDAYAFFHSIITDKARALFE